MTNLGQRWSFSLKPLLVLAGFFFLLFAVNPTFYADDSAETITAAVLLGLPHPPGYPLYTLLGHLFSGLPLGGFGFRVNLLSALLATLNSLLIFQLLKRWVGLSESWALPLSLFWLVGATTYPAALSAKTGLYELTAALLMTTVLALLEARWDWAGFFCGLSLANHWMTLLVLAPGLFLFGRDHVLGRENRSKIFVGCVGILAGLSLYLVLPLRAAHHPLLNWGNPVSWSSFWLDLTRAEYRGAEGNGRAIQWGLQAWVLLKDYFLEWPGLFLVAGVGAFTAWRVSAQRARGLLAGWFSLGLALAVYLNLSSDRFYLLKDYALASQSLTLLFAGFALKRLASKRGWKNGITLVLVMVLAGMGLWRFLGKRQTHYTYAYDYELNLFQELPVHSLFFARGDSLVFSAWYLQWVKGIRPDLAWVGVDGLPMGWIRQTLGRTHHDLHVPETRQRMGLESIPLLMKWMVDKNVACPLYLSFASIDPKIISGVPILDEGLVERAARGKNNLALTDAQQENLWGLLRFRHWREGEPVDGRTALFFADDYALHRNAEGLSAEARGDEWLAHAKGKVRARDYLKSQAAYGRALGDYLAALEWYPLEPKYAYNTGNALVELGRNQEALDYYAKAWTLNPRYAEAYFNAAVAASRLGQNQRAGDYFAKVLAFQPGYPQARENLDYLVKRGWYHP